MTTSRLPNATEAPNTADVYRGAYHVESVERSAAPVAGSPGAWHRYVVRGGFGAIVGYHRGTLEQTHEYAARFVDDLNHRRHNGIVPSGYRTNRQS